MNISKTHWVPLALASAIALSGCGGSGGPSDPRIEAPDDTNTDTNANDSSQQAMFCSDPDTRFGVVEFVPADGASDVETNRSIRVTFNANIDEASVSESTLPLELGNGASRIPVTYSVTGSTVVIDPVSEFLSGNTEYRVTATTSLSAACDGDVEKALAEAASSSFTTGEEMDAQAPRVVASSPQSGETLAATDSDVMVQFDEPIDPQTVTSDTLRVVRIDENGNELGQVEPENLQVNGDSVIYDPAGDFNGQSFYKIKFDSGITDLAGNPLELPSDEPVFRTGGLVVLLNDSLVSQIPVLGDGLNALGGQLLAPLEFGEADDGLSNLDNVLLLQVPLVSGLTDLLSGASNFSGVQTTTVDGTPFEDFSSALVAACDPKSVTTTDPAADCALGLDLGLDVTQLQSLADTFTGGDVGQVPTLIQSLATTLATGDFNNLPPELSEMLGGQLFPREDGLGVELRLVDDSSLPLPTPAEDGLLTVLDALGQIPVLGELFNQTDGKPLVDVGLLEGELLGLDLGGLASVNVLSGTETLIGENGILNLGGALFDALSIVTDQLPGLGDGTGGGVPLDPADLPLIGTLIGFLDLGNLDGVGLSPELLSPLTDLLQLPSDSLTPDNLPLVGELLSLLPTDLDSGALNDIPVLGDLISQLLSLNPGEDADLSQIPLVGDILNLITGGLTGGGESGSLDSLTDLLDPSQLQDLPLIGGILDGLLGALPTG
ncbi:Ig-like domain-containing protein [Marinobacter pelagius]|uniref:Ig-like domain-containing protein n=1 Tax=Marinobacter pelagius TaxID=379482 RepID=A0A366GFG6_9GAMM|nr:Ig-like domain-containing protein [Marinobacter pelagius]RBP25040.1 Ig-like domain-containing protein [Marinobacter pelagius]